MLKSPAGRVSLNGVTGFLFNYSFADLENIATEINLASPNCGATVNTLGLLQILMEDSSFHLINTLDAASISPGQNAIIGSRLQ